MNGITIEWLGGNCPVQAEGTFDDDPFYFRARGTQVTCDVGDWTWRGPEYEWPDAGYISEEVARAFISTAYSAWQARSTERALDDARLRRRNDISEQRMTHLMWAGRLLQELGDAGQAAHDWHMEQAQKLTDAMKDDE